MSSATLLGSSAALLPRNAMLQAPLQDLEALHEGRTGVMRDFGHHMFPFCGRDPLRAAVLLHVRNSERGVGETRLSCYVKQDCSCSCCCYVHFCCAPAAAFVSVVAPVVLLLWLLRVLLSLL